MSDERRPLNHREMVALEFIYALESKQEEMDCLEKRMREIGVWRYYRPAMALMIKVTNALLHSLCDRNLRHMKEIQDRYIVHLSPRPAVGKLSSDHIVSSDELAMLCNSCLRDRCMFCTKDVREAKGCKARDFFLRIAPPDEVSMTGMCEYALMTADDDK